VSPAQRRATGDERWVSFAKESWVSFAKETQDSFAKETRKRAFLAKRLGNEHFLQKD